MQRNFGSKTATSTSETSMHSSRHTARGNMKWLSRPLLNVTLLTVYDLLYYFHPTKVMIMRSSSALSFLPQRKMVH